MFWKDISFGLKASVHTKCEDEISCTYTHTHTYTQPVDPAPHSTFVIVTLATSDQVMNTYVVWLDFIISY